jgi:hypothetical protein
MPGERMKIADALRALLDVVLIGLFALNVILLAG